MTKAGLSVRLRILYCIYAQALVGLLWFQLLCVQLCGYVSAVYCVVCTYSKVKYMLVM